MSSQASMMPGLLPGQEDELDQLGEIIDASVRRPLGGGAGSCHQTPPTISGPNRRSSHFQSPPRLCGLPPEHLTAIARFLSLQEVAALAMVSKIMRAFVRSSGPLWRMLYLRRWPIHRPTSGSPRWRWQQLYMRKHCFARGWATDPVSFEALDGHKGEICAVLLAPVAGTGGNMVVTTGADATATVWRRWNANSEGCYDAAVPLKPCIVYEGHRGAVWGASLEGKQLATCSQDHTVRLWPSPESILNGCGDGFAGRRMRAERAERPIVIDGLEADCVLRGHTLDVWAVQLAAEGLVSGSADGTVRSWCRDSGRCVRVLEGHFQSVFAVSMQQHHQVRDTSAAAAVHSAVAYSFDWAGRRV